MRIIDRLFVFIAERDLSPYSFEKTCQVANGYLRKQQKGKGSIGSDIIEKIHQHFSDLSLIWLLTGEGQMLAAGDHESDGMMLREGRPQYTKDDHISALKERVALLETLLSDKEKIIKLMEREIKP
jgi:hypothetical protein